MDAELVKKILELDEKERKEVLKNLDSIEKIQKEITELNQKLANIKQQIEDRRNRISKLAESLPEFLRDGFVKPERKTGTGRKGKYTVYKDGQPVGKSLKEVFHEIYGKPVSWKYDAMIEFLEAHGYEVKIN